MKKIQEKEKERQRLISELLEVKKMIRGSFCEIRVKCGKKHCRCQKGIELHPHKRMSWKERGVDFSRAVPKEDFEWVGEMAGNYRKFRKLRREVRKLEEEIRALFGEYEEEIVNITRKERSYLDVWNTENNI